MRKNFLLTIYVLCFNFVFGQQQKIDSLTKLVKNYKPICNNLCIADSGMVKNLNELSFEIMYTNPDTALVLNIAALQLSQKINWPEGVGQCYNIFGSVHFVAGNFDSAIFYFNKALAHWTLLASQSNNKNIGAFKIQQAKALSNMGLVNWNKGEYKKAIDFYLEALPIFETLKDTGKMATVLGNIGLVCNDEGDFKNALDYYFKALKMNEATNDNIGIANMLANIGLVYNNLEEYSKALDYNKRALKVNEQNGNEYDAIKQYANIGMIYHAKSEEFKKQEKFAEADSNYTVALEFSFKSLRMATDAGYEELKANSLGYIAYIYSSNEEYAKAIDYNIQALKKEQELGNRNKVAFINGNLGSIFTKMKKYSEGEKYLLTALNISDSIGAVLLQRDNHESLSKLYEETHDYKKALWHHQKMLAARDSIFNEEKSKEFTRKEMQYEFEKKEAATKAEHDKAEAISIVEIKRQKLIRNVTMGSVFLGGLFAFMMVRTTNRRRKEVFEKTVSEVEMKALRAQMNPHFIFNSLQSIKKYILENEKNNAAEYLSKFAMLMRLILENSRKQEVTLEKDLSALEIYMQLEKLRFQNRFQYLIEVDAAIDKEDTLIPPLLLQPFVENSILHGVSAKENGVIKIIIAKRNQMLYCAIEDNGKGRNQNVKMEDGAEKKRESLGMKITQERLHIINQQKKVNATVNIVDLKDEQNNPAGLRVELLLPFESAF
nr:tetratricopeptide repeat protein [Bacteroidota bacterium]